jgi:endoglucanase
MKTFILKRGINIGGWLSQSKRRGRERVEFFTREDARRLAEMGFDHLRIPLDEEQLWDAAARREPEAWGLLNGALDWCGEYGLNAVVDLHILRSHYFMAAERPLFTVPREAERFGELWDELSRELQSRDARRVAYEFMNEPVAERHEKRCRAAA